MNFPRLAPGALALLILGTGCSKDDMIQMFASDEERAIASGYIEKLRQRQFQEIESRLDDSLRKPGVGDTLAQMSALIPAGKADSVKLVGAQSHSWNGDRSINLTYQYQFGDQWFLINCATRGEGNALRIMGLNVTQLPRSLEEEHQFTLAGKGPVQYAALAAAVVFVPLSLYALVLCIRDRNLRRKGAWVLFIILGVCTTTVNWSTGEWAFKPVSFQLLSVGAVSTPYGPWMISVALPLGALWYLLRRRRNQSPASLSNPS